MNSIASNLSIVVPVYSRPRELVELLTSVVAMSRLPKEVVLREDKSPLREQLADIAGEWTPILAARGCTLIYVENEENLGFDGNVRGLFHAATTDWVLILGNDDAILPDACQYVERFIINHPAVNFISRAFVRFSDSIDEPIGVSKFADADAVFDRTNSDGGRIFRLAGFVGGLIINRNWALSKESVKYDGTLYYQIYLAGVAFYDGGIGYVSTPIVGGRTGNPPLFGSAKLEKDVHVPGSYTPKGRAAMWRGVISIATDLQAKFGGTVLSEIKKELTFRQSFHIFEMTALQGRGASWKLFRELSALGLTGSLMPWLLLIFNLVFGRTAFFIYKMIRDRVQK